MNQSLEAFFLRLKSIVASKEFNILVTVVILFSTLLVGLSVEPSVPVSWKQPIAFLETIVLAFFSIEILVRIGAEFPKPVNFFKDAWNVFDFLIVLLCFLPLQTKFLFVLRVVRIFRTLRLFRAFPKLKIIINGMLNSFSSVLYVALLLFALVYIFAVIGVSVFSAVDPANFGSLPLAFFTLFQVLTLESWNVIMVPTVAAYPIGGPIYYVSFIILGTMIIMNLFLGVIVTNMNKAMLELEENQERSNEEKILDKMAIVEKRLEAIDQKLSKK